MTRTVRRKSRWWRHDHPLARRYANKQFRLRERMFLRKFGEPLRKSKDRGWLTW